MLKRVHLLILGDNLIGHQRVAPGKRLDGLGELILGEAAHLRQHRLEADEILVIGADNVIGHRILLANTQPKRPVI